MATLLPINLPDPPALIPPGVYIGLGEQRYHRDPALGSTSLKEIAKDPIDWQDERLAGDPDKDTTSIIWGRALHARVLEGPDAFASRFVCAPSLADHPKALVTMEHLKDHARSLDIKLKSRKEDLIKEIRHHDSEVPIWDEIMAAFDASLEGRTKVDGRLRMQIEKAARFMRADEKCGPVMNDAGVFCHGVSEVSVFYEDNGVRLKIRIDHLLDFAMMDLKSFRPPPGWTTKVPAVDRILGRVIAQQRYDLQAGAYIRGFQRVAALLDSGLVFGATDRDLAILRAAADASMRGELDWIWVLVKNTRAPQSFVRQFDPKSTTLTQGIRDIEDAIDTFRDRVAEFGADKEWTPRNVAGVLDDSSFPTYLGL